MAIVECPECKLKISSSASSCPRCGFTNSKRNNALIVIIILLIIVVFLLIGLLVASFFYALNRTNDNASLDESVRHSIIQDSADPYGIAGENNILGKNITDVLSELSKDVEYTINKTSDGYEYVLKNDIYYPIGEDASIEIYVPATSNEIDMVAYMFYMPNNTSNFTSQYGYSKIIQFVTDYYDADPEYNLYTDDGFVVITKEQFNQYLHSEEKVVHFIYWETDSMTIALEIPNIYQDKRVDCRLGFSLK